jgi:hypothetical protein
MNDLCCVFAKLKVKLSKLKVWFINYFRLFFLLRTARYKHISTKHNKSVFYKGGQYFIVYNGSNNAHLFVENKAVLKPVKTVGGIYIYNEINVIQELSDVKMFCMIAMFHEGGRCSSTELYRIAESTLAVSVINFLSDRVTEVYGRYKIVNTVLCHGDVTLNNLLEDNGKLYFIDFDDSFEYVESYDYIYFQVLSKLSIRCRYVDVFNSIGLHNGDVFLSNVLTQIDRLCENKKYSELEYMLFLKKLLESALLNDAALTNYISKVNMK